MRFREREKPRLGLEIAPLIDVVFLLLIFFLLSSSFIFQPGIKVKLPEATTSEIKPKKDIFITITKDEALYLNGKITDMETLSSQLKKLILEDKQRFVIIKADKDTRHGKVVEVLDISKMVGVERLGIATSPRSKEEEGEGE
ncbi:MAG: biopolymer transporter ExbD [bacterium]|nr:biopolymer transporter ExbD [bacterium]